MKKKPSKQGGSNIATPVTPPLSTGRKLLFGIVGFGILPLLFLVGVELCLRVAGVGEPTSFFRKLRIGDKQYYVENDKFGLRFFPPQQARSPSPTKVAAVKEPGTVRIFVLGESAALGDPRPAFGAARYLKVLLEERHPEKKFEVVCAAVTAINSHALVEIARECAHYGGDLWIVYMGNNEMVGPFGATTVFGSQAPPRAYVRLSLAIQSTRIGQLLMRAGRKLTQRSGKDGTWGGMQMWTESRIPAVDARKEVVYENFRRNLQDILAAGRDAGAKVILNAVAVNLKDCAPFASLTTTNLPASKQESLASLMAKGNNAQTEAKNEEALAAYSEAAKLDSTNAELFFRMGTCGLLATNLTAASNDLAWARDCDALPFRTDSRLNAIIRKAAQGHDDLRFVDAEELFATNSPAGVPGFEAFYEHVHFNFDGNYRLACAWARAAEDALGAALTTTQNASWASQALCERRLALSDWNRYAVWDDVLSRLGQPPFTNQLNHADQVRYVEATLRGLKEKMDAPAAEQARAMYLDAIQRDTGDHRLHENYAEFLEARGNLAEAVAQWEQVKELLPYHHVAYFQAGRLQMRLGRLPEAEAYLQRAVALRPDLAEGWLLLGQVHALQGNLEVALNDFQKELSIIPNDHRAFYHAGKVLSKAKRGPEAIQKFREALRLRPGFWEARYALGEELAFSGQTQEAKAQFEEVLRVRPNHSLAHLNLGVALFQEKQYAAALRHFEDAYRLDPNNRLAADYVQKLQRLRSR